MSSRANWQRVAELIGELDEMSVADTTGMIGHLLKGTSEILSGSDTLVAFAVRDGNAPSNDPLSGWRNSSILYRYGPHAERDAALLGAWYRHAGTYVRDPVAVVAARTMGTPRAILHRDIMDDRAWTQTKIQEVLDESRIRDRLLAARPVAPDVEIVLIAYRRDRERQFAEHERDTLVALMTSFTGIARRLALAHGLVDASKPLSPREQQVLLRLLNGCSEKQIAAELGLTDRYLHNHVTTLYRKFGVHGRAELMARFLGPVHTRATGATVVGQRYHRQ